jgi:phosphoenolpyruvate synthase/pyruvate phosphate dikinase
MYKPTYLIQYDSHSPIAVSLVGRKAARLLELRNAGLSVPPFFVVSSQAWSAYCEPLIKGFESFLRQRGNLDDQSLSQLGLSIRNAVVAITFTDQFRDELQKLLADQYSSHTLAVRSSALSEDQPTKSFAGVYDSYLDVKPEDVEFNILRCWASAFSLRALRYSLDAVTSSFRMAVIVQQMRHFDLSGVVFTVDPVARRHTLVEVASVSTPESIVSGALTPARLIFDNHLDLVDTSGDESISVACARRIAAVGQTVETLFGAPQDIEFGVKGEDIVLLQSRPITTLDLR